jgi:hypothetical protein
VARPGERSIGAGENQNGPSSFAAAAAAFVISRQCNSRLFLSDKAPAECDTSVVPSSVAVPSRSPWRPLGDAAAVVSAAGCVIVKGAATTREKRV